MPEEKSQYEKILKRQARRLANFTECKLNQAQRTIAIDFYGYKSLKDLKLSLENGAAQRDTINLLEFSSSPECLISLQRNWEKINDALDKVEYLESFDRTEVIACILNMPKNEFESAINQN
ncbi:hypothetical protein [Pseudoalteromonas sp. Ld20]|uniref:hypothetical protein n=1 Tax=Pseudoalteromonas sp. Ld20 TaxID=649165 RepID=UPI00386E96DE